MRNRSLTAAALAALIALALLGAGCYGQTPSGTEPGATEPGGTGGTAPGGSTGGTAPSGPAVTMQNFAFNPPSLEVKVGDTVTWTNQDSAPHNVAGDAFKSPDMATGATFTFTFDKAGTYSYKCGIHPSMTGTVVVK